MKTKREVLGSLLWVRYPQYPKEPSNLVWASSSVYYAEFLLNNPQVPVTWSLDPDLSTTVFRVIPEEWL